jgi:superfamily II DNA or RNA helicase
MKIVVDSKIIIYDPPFVMVAAMKKALSLRNPVYDTLARRVKYGNQSMKCLYAVKQFFQYFKYDKQRNIFECGRGNLGKLINYLDKTGLKAEFTYDFVDKKLSKELRFNGKLRDYQEGVVDKVVDSGDKCGVIRLDVAFGKTLIACELIRKLNLTTLILVPRKLILDQFIDTFKKFYNYMPAIIQGNKFEIGEITVASIETLKKRDLSKIKNYFSILIVDECHLAVTNQRISLIQEFNPKYLYGLTGTMDRDDGQADAINFVFGEKLIDKKLPQEKPIVYKIKTNSNIEVDINYADMVENLINDDKRNLIIKNIIEKEAKEGRKILCLGKRIAHNKIIKDLLNKDIKAFTLDSDTKDKEKLFMEFRNGKEFDVILGTFALLSTGINLEILSTLIIASDLKGRVITNQSVGRCLRTMLNKPGVRIYDLVDDNNGVFLSQWRQRRKLYLENGWQIIN